MQYVFKKGSSEVSFEAASDVAAWIHVAENHSTSRTIPIRGETLYRIDRVSVDRPTPEELRRHEQLIATFNKAGTT